MTKARIIINGLLLSIQSDYTSAIHSLEPPPSRFYHPPVNSHPSSLLLSCYNLFGLSNGFRGLINCIASFEITLTNWDSESAPRDTRSSSGQRDTSQQRTKQQLLYKQSSVHQNSIIRHPHPLTAQCFRPKRAHPSRAL